jgi:hypothetical protein
VILRWICQPIKIGFCIVEGFSIKKWPGLGLKGQGFPKDCCRGVAKSFEILEIANVAAASRRASHGVQEGVDGGHGGEGRGIDGRGIDGRGIDGRCEDSGSRLDGRIGRPHGMTGSLGR